MVPAEERLEPLDPVVAEIERRLVDELELVVEQGPAQVGGEPEAALGRFVQVLQTIYRYWLELALLPPPPE